MSTSELSPMHWQSLLEIRRHAAPFPSFTHTPPGRCVPEGTEYARSPASPSARSKTGLRTPQLDGAHSAIHKANHDRASSSRTLGPSREPTPAPQISSSACDTTPQSRATESAPTAAGDEPPRAASLPQTVLRAAATAHLTHDSP